MNNGMPPRCRNQREPTACDTPTASAAFSLVIPVAICIQNSLSISRRCEGAPGECIASLPVNCFIHPAGLPINTSWLKVLRRPVESAQYVSILYTERLAEAGIEPSVGSRGDSYDNALAETINGLYKAELIHRRAPWKTKEALELATLEWVAWFNHHRLLSSIGYIPPAEAEVNYYRQLAGKNETEVST